MKFFRMYIDESGDHSYGKMTAKNFIIKGIKNGEDLSIPFDDYPQLEGEKRYLGVTGSIIDVEKYRTVFHPGLEGLKQKHFPHSPDDPVILHRTDIINKRGPFCRLRDPEREKTFDGDLLAFLKNQDYSIISVVIDKKAHIGKYVYPEHPYHYCLLVLLERYCGFLRSRGGRGDVIAESRGGREDIQLKEEYRHIYNSGTRFIGQKIFQNVLTSKELKLKPKKTNIAGLQLADILAYPVKHEILRDNGIVLKSKYGQFGEKVCEAIQGKYNKYGRVFLK